MLMARALGTASPDAPQVAQAVARFEDHYAACALEQTRPFPGIPQLLQSLPQPKAVVSNKPGAFCRRILEGLGLAGEFRAIHGGDAFAERKPSPVPFAETARELCVAPSQAVVIGDGRQDMAAGQAAGAVTVGVTWGQGSADVLLAHGADHVVASVAELGERLDELQRAR